MFECLIFEEQGTVMGSIDRIYPETKIPRETKFLGKEPDISDADQRVMDLVKIYHDCFHNEGEDRDYYQKEICVYKNDVWITTSLLPSWSSDNGLQLYAYRRYYWVLEDGPHSMIRRMLKEPAPASET